VFQPQLLGAAQKLARHWLRSSECSRRPAPQLLSLPNGGAFFDECPRTFGRVSGLCDLRDDHVVLWPVGRFYISHLKVVRGFSR
jgi:hypothetical protein